MCAIGFTKGRTRLDLDAKIHRCRIWYLGLKLNHKIDPFVVEAGKR
jgi:hypothetical protein